VYGWKRGEWLATGLRLERTLYFSASVGLGDVVVLFLYTNLHCTCENMLFCRAMATFASAHRLAQGSSGQRESTLAPMFG
jgi:hypothetical protein